MTVREVTAEEREALAGMVRHAMPLTLERPNGHAEDRAAANAPADAIIRSGWRPERAGEEKTAHEIISEAKEIAGLRDWLERTRDERHFPAHLFGWCEEADQRLEAIFSRLTSEPQPMRGGEVEGALRRLRQAEVKSGHSATVLNFARTDARALLAVLQPPPTDAQVEKLARRGDCRLRKSESGGGDYFIEIELPCINGLSAWFLIATIWATDLSAVEITDGAFPCASNTANAILAALRPPAEELVANMTRGLPGGMDDATYEQIEEVLDRADAPIRANGDSGPFLKLHERVQALHRDLTEARERVKVLDGVIAGVKISAYPAHGSGFVAIITEGGADLQKVQAALKEPERHG